MLAFIKSSVLSKLAFLPLLSDVVVGGFGIGQIAIAIVVFAAVVALVYVALNKFGIGIPDWVQSVVWIVIVAVVIILAIKFIISLW